MGNRVRYSNCWEDAAVLGEALAPLEHARCLSIASAGDNTLSLLARGATSVLAVDRSFAQLALLELKLCAFRSFSHPEVLAFLGARPSDARPSMYAALREWLGDASRAFWDARRPELAAGVLHAGKLERYFGLFRRFVLPFTHGRAAVERLLAPAGPEERARLYHEVWDNSRWRAVGRLFFSRAVFGRLGRDAELFRFAEGPVAQTLLEGTRGAFTLSPRGRTPTCATS